MDTVHISAPSHAPSSGVVHINVRLTGGFTIISNRLSQRRGMSLLAIGLGTHIQSLPPGSKVGVKVLANAFPESEARIAAALRELEHHGFLRRIRERVGGGRFTTRTEFYNHPEAAAGRTTPPSPARGPRPRPPRAVSPRRSVRSHHSVKPRPPRAPRPHRSPRPPRAPRPRRSPYASRSPYARR
ncbi:hypothetical protein [Streptomyces pratensis]|uniref:hypothetical protein n=1 Tax=Streptomyces pratensis TaxID=1169025 RepID=UPI003019E532